MQLFYPAYFDDFRLVSRFSNFMLKIDVREFCTNYIATSFLFRPSEQWGKVLYSGLHTILWRKLVYKTIPQQGRFLKKIQKNWFEIFNFCFNFERIKRESRLTTAYLCLI